MTLVKGNLNIKRKFHFYIFITYTLSAYGGHAIWGHLVIAKTSFRGTSQITVKLSYKNPYKAKTFIADNCYSGYKFLTPLEKIKPNLHLYSGHTTFFMGK